MTVNFYMDQSAIKQAAINFRQALLEWKTTLWKTVPIYYIPISEWTQDDETMFHNAQIELVDWVLDGVSSILDLAIAGDIEEPFDFSGYTRGKFGYLFSNELSYSELEKPLAHLTSLLRGGLL
jgi:hypothetical protein